MTEPRIEAAARSLWDDHRVSRDPDWDDIVASGERYADDVGQMRDMATAALAAADKAGTITTVEGLDALPVGTVVYAANHIGPAERFLVGWMGCGNTAAWSSPVLARDGLPARVIHWGTE